MSAPENARFINNLSIQVDTSQPEQFIASQQAKIGNRTVTIQLHFSRNVTEEEAKAQMERTLSKIAKLEIPATPQTKQTLNIDPSILDLSPADKVQNAALPLIPTKIVIETWKDLPFPPLIPSPPKISAAPSTQGAKGKELADQFLIGNRKIATEKAVRADTVTALTQGLKTKIDRLEKKLAAMEAHDPKRAALETELKKTKDQLERYSRKSANATWGSTNTPRFAFREMGRREAKQALAPIACNLRIQTVEDANGNIVSSVTRSGALSDFRHGEVSLKELKELLASTSSPEVKIKALVGYGVEALISTEGAQANLTPILKKLQDADSIMSAYAKLSGSEQLQLLNAQIDEKKLEQVISDRSRHMKLMALQDLQLHLKTVPAQGNPVLYSRTSLLDLRKTSHNEHGLIIDEKTQGLDMKALFDELEGATLHFDCQDGEEAYIDEEGMIHLPKNCAANGIESSTLTTAFFNICAQGSSERTQNSGLQQGFNAETMEKLRNRYGNSDEFHALEVSLARLSRDPKLDPNDTVLATTLLIQKLGGYSGINCFGGKDRTGYAVAQLTHHHICRLGKKARSSETAKEWGLQLMGKKGVGSRIAQDNADHTALKLTRLDLKLFGTDTLKGKMVRVAQLAKGVVMGTKKFLIESLGTTYISESETKGQLYRPNMKVRQLSPNRILSKITSLIKNSQFHSIF